MHQFEPTTLLVLAVVGSETPRLAYFIDNGTNEQTDSLFHVSGFSHRQKNVAAKIFMLYDASQFYKTWSWHGQSIFIYKA